MLLQKFFRHKKRAASLTSYGLIVGLIAIIAITSIDNIGNNISSLFSKVSNDMDKASSSGSGSSASAPTTDTTPDIFDFTDITNVNTSTLVQSTIIQITGLDDANVSITGNGSPAFRLCNDATCSADPTFQTSSATITNAEYLQLQLTSSAAAATTFTASVTIGTVSDNWSVTPIAWGPAVFSSLNVGSGWEIQCTNWSGTTCQGLQINVPTGQGIDAGWWNMNNANSSDGQTACDRFCQLATGSTFLSCSFPNGFSAVNTNPNRRLFSYSSGSVTLTLPSPAASIAPLTQTSQSINNQGVVCNW